MDSDVGRYDGPEGSVDNDLLERPHARDFTILRIAASRFDGGPGAPLQVLRRLETSGLYLLIQ